MRRVPIVGAGPAGTATAQALRRARGVEVVLLDAATFPRDKICAGGLSAKAQRVLDRLGMLPSVLAEAHAIRRLRLVGPGGEEWSLERARSVVLPRLRFDELMVRAAQRAGAILREGVRARGLLRTPGRVCGVATDAGDLEADVTVVAAGVRATNALGPPADPPHRLLAVERRYEGWDFDPHAMEMLYARELLPGYGWVFPESRTRANVGVCVDEHHPEAGALHGLLDAFQEAHLGSRVRDARPVDQVRGAPIAWRASVPELAGPGVLWVGEAAGLTSAATGEGIWHALVSGVSAAETIADVIEEGDLSVLSRHRRRCTRALGLPLLSASAFARAASLPVFPAALRIGTQGPFGRLAKMVLERL